MEVKSSGLYDGGGGDGSNSSIIRPINKSVVHRICSGQVILDLSSAVKELVENSLDAGATSIEISLKEYGEESFQVVDNGCGICPQNYQVLALKHHTSKLSDFPDLQSLTTFGFRGEALSSLCSLGDLSIETRTNNEPVATHLTFDHSGLLVDQRKTARKVGTSVTVKRLFSTLPVRSKQFQRNIRKEYGKLITLLNAYALIAKGVRLVCTNTTGRNVKSTVLKTQGNGSLKDNIITVFGMSTFNCLQSVRVDISNGCIVDGFVSKPGNGSGRNLGDRQFFFVNDRPVDLPKVSKLVNELYRGANSRQYPIAIMNFSVPTNACDVNVTPDKRKVFFCDEGFILSSLRDALGNIYSSDHASYSVSKAEELPKEDHISKVTSRQDTSQISIKKTRLECSNTRENTFHGMEISDTVGLVSEKEETKDFAAAKVGNGNLDSSTEKDSMLGVNNSVSRKSEKVLKNIDSFAVNQHQPCDAKPIMSATYDSLSLVSNPKIVQSSLNNFVTVNKRKHESIGTTLSEIPLLRKGPGRCQLIEDKLAKHGVLQKFRENRTFPDNSDEFNNNGSADIKASSEKDLAILSAQDMPIEQPKEGLRDQEEMLQVSERNNLETTLDSLPDTPNPLQSSGPSSDSPVTYSLKVGSTLQFSFKDLITRRQQRLKILRSMNLTSGKMSNKRSYIAATLELAHTEKEEGKASSLTAATRELERLFKKEDFGQMKVIGQFNLGFIIGKLDYDLFIVDQHAADEKFNYESLSQSTVLNQQPLLRHVILELSPEEEVVVSMHMDVIRRNGFSLEEDMLAPPGKRYKLKAVPFSKKTTFGVGDVIELITMLADDHGECSTIGSYRTDAADSVCPSRVRAMFASRACKSSVMIGDPLGKNEMHKILGHLAHLNSPWNCPHGRPTMRHLVDLRTLNNNRVDDDDDDDDDDDE